MLRNALVKYVYTRPEEKRPKASQFPLIVFRLAFDMTLVSPVEILSFCVYENNILGLDKA